jgi:hypothetical protein
MAPYVLIAGICGLAVAYLIYREWRIVHREDQQWERELAAAECEDERLVEAQKNASEASRVGAGVPLSFACSVRSHRVAEARFSARRGDV